jgi:hypothetical protein
MANTTVASGNQVIKFRSDFFKEYFRDGRFDNETGKSNDNVHVIKNDKKQISIPLVSRLDNQGKSGSSTLRGSGEALPNSNILLTPTYYRNAVEYDKEEGDKPAFELMTAAKPALMDWAQELKRDQIILACGAVSASDTYIEYGDATAANHNTWAVANSDRILYGNATTNYSGVHATDLAKCDTTNDRADGDIISLLKRIAKNARPRIRPIRVKNGREYFVAYVDSYVFRDIKTDLRTSHQNAMPRSRDNILFQDGDIEWDGVIVKEVPEIADFIDGGSPIVGEGNETGANWSALATAGNSSTRVSPIFLCGQQATGFGLGQAPNIIVDPTWDYNFQPGVAIECKHDIDKAFFSNDVQHGVVTGWVSAPIST